VGVSWGILRYPAEYDPDRLVAEWRPLAAVPLRREFTVLRGDQLHHFRRLPTRDASGAFDVSTTAAPAPELAKQVAGLLRGDGTYDLFAQLFDGIEVLVPWTVARIGKVDKPGCPIDGRRADGVDQLIESMRRKVAAHRTEPPDDPDLARLAKELLAAGRLAKKARTFLEIGF
jgi:hypothetical protein